MWKLAKKAIQFEERGMDEDDALAAVTEAMNRLGGYNSDMQHMARTVVKGAYIRDKSESASRFAARVQAECMSPGRD